MTALDIALAPAEGPGVLVVSFDERCDSGAEFVLAFEAATVESLPLQKTEHDFNLIEPTGRGRGKVKPDAAFELRQPVVVLLMRGVPQRRCRIDSDPGRH